VVAIGLGQRIPGLALDVLAHLSRAPSLSRPLAASAGEATMIRPLPTT
jgi:hypothetical protein